MKLWSENAKTGQRRVRDIRARLFRNGGATSGHPWEGGGDGHGPDAGGAVFVARESVGHGTRQLRYTYPEKSSAVTTKRRSMVGRGGVDGATIASHVVGAGGYSSAGTRLSERITAGKRDETLVSSRR